MVCCSPEVMRFRWMLHTNLCCRDFSLSQGCLARVMSRVFTTRIASVCSFISLKLWTVNSNQSGRCTMFLCRVVSCASCGRRCGVVVDRNDTGLLHLQRNWQDADVFVKWMWVVADRVTSVMQVISLKQLGNSTRTGPSDGLHQWTGFAAAGNWSCRGISTNCCSWLLTLTTESYRRFSVLPEAIVSSHKEWPATENTRDTCRTWTCSSAQGSWTGKKSVSGVQIDTEVNTVLTIAFTERLWYVCVWIGSVKRTMCPTVKPRHLNCCVCHTFHSIWQYVSDWVMFPPWQLSSSCLLSL